MGVRPAVLLVLAAWAVAGCGGDDGDDRPSPREARRCLEQLALHVTPGRWPADAPAAPERELIANDVLRGRLMLSALYYADEDAAERIEPAQRRDARSQDGRVERHGTVTLVWRYGHEGRFAERARRCIL